MSIKNIIFDLGGVLIDFDPERMIRDCSLESCRGLVMQKVFGSEHWLNMDKGLEPVEQAVENMLCDIPPEYHERIRHMILDREEMMPPIKQMTPIIDSLYESGYRLFVLTNCAKWFHQFKNTIPSIEKFEGFTVSADYGIIKPDERIYKILLDTFSLNAEECFFIDDSIKNTDAAEVLGFRTHCFKDRDFDKLRQELHIISKPEN